MDNSSYFIKNRALFGSFPTQDSVLELEDHGVRYFVDLTDITKEKKISAYTTKYTYINYSIDDHSIPNDILSFSTFVLKISNIIKKLNQDERVYIHCRGGHGRSGLVVACILCYIFNLSPQDSLNYTTKCHSHRKNMRDRWRKLGSPQNYNQKKFVYKFFEPVYFYRYNKNTSTEGFSMFSEHYIETELGEKFILYTSYYKHIEKYAEENKLDIDKIDDKNKLKIMKNLIKLKLNTFPNLKNNILNTGLKNIMYVSKEDGFWGNGENNIGKNYLGKLLVKIRNEYFEEDINS
jgi:protein-tyrosine phosphatase